jgi:hypothetical protein
VLPWVSALYLRDAILTAEYRRIIEIKGVSLFYWISNEPSISIFDRRNSIFSYCLYVFYILVELSFFSIDLKNVSCAFLWLIATASIVVWVPLGTAVLICFYYMLFWPLTLTFSLPYCSIQGPNFFSVRRILCGINLSILPSIMFLKLFHTSSTRLPLPAHSANVSRRKVCRPKIFGLWYAGTSLSTWGRQ